MRQKQVLENEEATTEKTSNYELRTFRDGDEIKIVQLFEKNYSNYGGYTLRSPEYWRWCCLQRPDMEKEGILIALDKKSKEIVGYAVVGKSGSLWELSYDPNNNGEELVSLLLDKATAYLEQAGAASINFTAPQKDRIIQKVCKEHGFTVGKPPKMFLSVLNFQRLVSLLANNKADELTAKFNESILIELTDAPFWINDTIFLQINPNGITVDQKRRTPTIQLQTDCMTFSSLLFENTTPFNAFIHLKLKIKPLLKIMTMLKLLSNLRIGAEWSFQLSEYG